MKHLGPEFRRVLLRIRLLQTAQQHAVDYGLSRVATIKDLQITAGQLTEDDLPEATSNRTHNDQLA